MTLKIGIIGCGTIGQKRAKSIFDSPNSEIFGVYDINQINSKHISDSFGGKVFDNWSDLLNSDKLDAVVVSTTNNKLSFFSHESLKKNKHVFCEKPLGRNIEEVENVVLMAKNNDLVFKTGFTLRFHPGIQKLKTIVDSKLGKILFARCRYGITGRPGYEKEWRANLKISGGGELIDQGIHIFDLMHWFLGDFKNIQGYLGTLFWNVTVEDNAFVQIKAENGSMGSFHVSWSQWNNLFSFEIFGAEGYAKLEGLGGVYGEETLTVGKKSPPDKWPPEETIDIFPNPEICWSLEWKDFEDSIIHSKIPNGSGDDGLYALRSVMEIYEKNN